MTQTKRAANAFALPDNGPLAASERVLSAVRSRPDAAAAPFSPDDGLLVPGAIDGVTLADAPVGDATSGGGFPPLFGAGPIGGIGVVANPGGGGGGGSVGGGGGGGGGDFPPGGTIPGDGNVPVVPAIPEPATWLTMLIGFFAIGGMMRAWPRTVQHRSLPLAP